jgi:hypothetical protein
LAEVVFPDLEDHREQAILHPSDHAVLFRVVRPLVFPRTVGSLPRGLTEMPKVPAELGVTDKDGMSQSQFDQFLPFLGGCQSSAAR